MCNHMIELLRELIAQEYTIQHQYECGIINEDEFEIEQRMVKKRQSTIIKELALSVHKTNNGRPRTISYDKTKKMWVTVMPDRSRIYAQTEDALYSKIISAYGIALTDMTVQGMFTAALRAKSSEDNNNLKTISHYEADFKRFIDSEFAHKDIRSVSKSTLKEYSQKLVNNSEISDKAFLKYKGVLNLIFGYAHENGYIDNNPVYFVKNRLYLKSCSSSKGSSEEKILSPEEIERVKLFIRNRMTNKRYPQGYYINGYAMLFAIETGMRAAELPALKWDDIHEDYIHIHAQQLDRPGDGGKEYYYAPYTKDEKGISKGGRLFPLTDAIKALLVEIKALQDTLNIHSEYIFIKTDGEWIKTDAYETSLRRLMRSCGMPLTNNHAFRMSLNSNVFIPLDIPVTERARLLGHSVETNLRHYSYSSKDGIDDLKALLNGHSNEVAHRSHKKVVSLTDFQKKKKLGTR